MSDLSGKVVRGGCFGSVLGGVVGAILGGILGAIVAPPPTPILGLDLAGLAVVTFGFIGLFPGAVVGAIIGARRAVASPSADSGASSEEELARLRKRVEELEGKTTSEAIKRKDPMS